MATTVAPAAQPHERHTRRRPFSSWVRRLANLKSSGTSSQTSARKKNGGPAKATNHSHNNNPYPESTAQAPTGFYSPPSLRSPTVTTHTSDTRSFTSYEDPIGSSLQPVFRSNRSTAPTFATNPETINSDAGFSKGGTSFGGARSYRDGRANSTFSSPQHSQESLTTTLTTIHSTTPSGIIVNYPHANGAAGTPVGSQFTHQYPISPPASALPGHLNPNTYTAATANGVLSDNASIVTLASSSKRRRRRSLDTNASVRAIAPSSLFGASRESLPLSVLSSNVLADSASGVFTPGAAGAAGRPAFASTERASVYSSSGVPALSSERNSYYAAGKAVDGASVRSGRVGHGRENSISGSIGPAPQSATQQLPMPGLGRRRSSRMSVEVTRDEELEDGEEGGEQGVRGVEEVEGSGVNGGLASQVKHSANDIGKGKGKAKATD